MRRLLPGLFFFALVPLPVLAEPPSAGGEVVSADHEDDQVEDDSAAPVPRRGAPIVTSYRGVAPGTDHLPPRSAGRASKFDVRATSKGPARLTWVGFQVREGVPTVFVELSHPVAWSVAEKSGKLVYTLVGATVPLSNNRRTLEVKEFGTAIDGVETKSRGRDVEVTIRLKEKVAVAHKERNEDAAGGLKFLVVELPRGAGAS